MAGRADWMWRHKRQGTRVATSPPVRSWRGRVKAWLPWLPFLAVLHSVIGPIGHFIHFIIFAVIVGLGGAASVVLADSRVLWVMILGIVWAAGMVAWGVWTFSRSRRRAHTQSQTPAACQTTAVFEDGGIAMSERSTRLDEEGADAD